MKAAPTLTPVEVILKKRNRRELSVREIADFVDGFVTGSVADYQMSAWLMAAFLNGLSEGETVALTDAMLRSGEVLKLASVSAPKVDKHSTGGVGDKISICLAPLVAACGVAVPMVSGRGLGHTGGTLDKLESIPGFSVGIHVDRFERIVRELGLCMIGQTEELAPADRRMYALRDVTGTVESVPLIVASILSKKLAEGIDALVLDIKCGNGAFMKDVASARELGRALVRVGHRAGKKTVALITDMNRPLGKTVGNALELGEAIDVLAGKGPADTRELTLALGAEMLLVAGAAKSAAAARQKLEQAIRSGEGLERFARMVHAQGGDSRVVHHPERLPKARQRLAVHAAQGGYVRACDALELGWVAVALGAGRKRAEDRVDHAVGIELCANVGDRVEAGEPLAFLHVQSKSGTKPLLERVARAFVLARSKPRATPLVIERLTKRA